MRPATRFQLAIALAASVLLAPAARAVPSFARQTGMACAACHTVFPALTHFGRVFKANGYVLDNLQQVRAVNSDRQQLLSLSRTPTFSVMMQISYTTLNKRLPDGSTGNPNAPGLTQSGTAGFPQQLSLFYAGKIAPHLGVFSQITYGNDSGTIGIDNTDVRFAKEIVLPHKNTLTYGISLNNNPTVQDLWNDTPAWGFPYAASDAVVSPLAATQIDGTLAQSVAGLTGYIFFDESLYVEFGGYRSAPQGQVNELTGQAGPLDGSFSNVIEGISPYWRVAYEYDWGANALEVGTYGAEFKLHPGGGLALEGPDNRFQDIAEDFQYQYVGENNIVTVAGTRIHENMHLDASYLDQASANVSDSLTTSRIWASYYYQRKYGGQLEWFSTTGSTDNLLYPATVPGGCDLPDNGPLSCGVITSANGSPDTDGFVGQVDYLPWLNVKLALQYTYYDKFNGATNNYDGVGRNAADNNSLYLMLWYAF